MILAQQIVELVPKAIYSYDIAGRKQGHKGYDFPPITKLSGYRKIKSIVDKQAALLGEGKSDANVKKMKSLRRDFLEEFGFGKNIKRSASASKKRRDAGIPESVDPSASDLKEVTALLKKSSKYYRAWVPLTGFFKVLNDYVAPVVGVVVATVATAGIGAAAAGTAVSAGTIGTTAGAAALKAVKLPGKEILDAVGDPAGFTQDKVADAQERAADRLAALPQDAAKSGADLLAKTATGQVPTRLPASDKTLEGINETLADADSAKTSGISMASAGLLIGAAVVIALIFRK